MLPTITKCITYGSILHSNEGKIKVFKKIPVHLIAASTWQLLLPKQSTIPFASYSNQWLGFPLKNEIQITQTEKVTYQKALSIYLDNLLYF